MNFEKKINLDLFLIGLIEIYFLIRFFSLIKLDIIDSSDAWLDLHQSIFQGAIFTGFLLTCFKNHALRCLWIGWFLGMASENSELFSNYIHNFFIESGFYTLIMNPQFNGNPQHATLLFYGLIFFLQLPLLLQKKFRSLNIVFSLLFMSINLLIALMNHTVFPSGIMQKMIEDKKVTMERLDTSSPIAFKQYCIQFDARCRIKKNNKTEVINDPDFNFDKDQKELLESISLGINENSPQYMLETNQLRGIYLTSIYQNNVYEIFEHNYINKIWSVTLGYFSRNSFIISHLWFLFTGFLIFIHRRKKWF